MKDLILLFCLIFFFCISCEKEAPDPDPGPESPVGDKITESTIGAAGGILESEDVLLTVPAGALDTTLTLALYLEEDAHSRPGNQVTQTYRLTGLNAAWSKPLELSVKYEGTLEGENYIALGYSYYDQENEDTIMANELFEARDSLGFIKCFMPPLEVEVFTKKAGLEHPVKYHPLVFHTRLMLRGMSSMGTVISECAEIKYDRTLDFDRSKVEQLAAYMDEAVHFFHTIGIMNADYFRGKNKVRVQILDDPKIVTYASFIESDIKPVLEALSLSKDHLPSILLQTYLFKIQGQHFQSLEDLDLKMLAANGVHRFINNCYFGDKKNWLLWAINFWVTEYFHGSYPGSLQYSMYMHSFHGMNILNLEKYLDVFPTQNPGRLKIAHGKGMSPLIKYLMENHNDNLDFMKNLYVEMQKPGAFHQPINALLSNPGLSEYVWWPGFFKAFLSGKVRNIPGEMFINEIDPEDQIYFDDENDTVMYFDRQYPDLSAKLCKVNLPKYLTESILGDKDKLTFQLGPESLNMNYVKVLVFSYKDGKLEFISEGQEVTLDNIKAKIDNGYTSFLAVVVNSASESPYEEELKIDLTVRIQKKLSWPWKYLAFKAVVTDAVFKSGTNEYTWAEYEFKLPDKLVDVSEDGTRFTASWLDKTSDYKYEGGMDVSMDLETYNITGFHMWSNTENYSDGIVTLREKTEMKSKGGLSIPVVHWDDVFCNHQVLKEEVCAAIETFTYEHCFYPGAQNELKNTLVSYTCEDEAELLFFWANRPIGVLSGSSR